MPARSFLRKPSAAIEERNWRERAARAEVALAVLLAPIRLTNQGGVRIADAIKF